MQSSTPVVDIHTHATLKPYGNSFYKNTNPGIDGDPACIWTSDKFSAMDQVYENTVGVSRYRQSDFNSLVDGKVRITVISLYPQEVGFFRTKQNLPGPIEVLVAQFASLFGKARIKYLMDEGKEPYNYYKDLTDEYNYLLKYSTSPVIGNSRKYHLPKSSEDFGVSANLYVIPSIEGAHVFCNGTDTLDSKQWEGVEDRIAEVKAWHSPPLFITLAHHFYNGLCTHAYSLSGASAKLLDQTLGMRDYDYNHSDDLSAISELGFNVIDSMLNTSNGRRILVDIKHMSREARVAYYNFLDSDYKNEEIPILCSHGALTNYYNHEVNLELELDVAKIYESQGLFGIEMDQRVLGYSSKNKTWQRFKNIFRRRKVKEHLQTEYVWKNILSIAEFAYQKGYRDNPWQCICIGSDYDGIINPLNNYRDASCFPNLYNSLIKHLEDYWKKPSIIPKGNAAEVIYTIMYENAFDFIQRNYKP